MSRIWRVIAGLCLPVAASAGPVTVKEGRPIPGEGRRIALVFGVAVHGDQRWPALEFAASDADAVGHRLQMKDAGFDLVMMYTAPEETTKASMERALRGSRNLGLRAEDTLVVYFSGHGTIGVDAYSRVHQVLVASDTTTDRVLATGIKRSDVIDGLRPLPPRRKALILAACHSGAGKSWLPDASKEALRRRKGIAPLFWKSEAFVVLSAAAWNEVALESKALRGDVYTHFLLEALDRGADTNEDGAITLAEAHDYARARAYAFTKGQQRASAESELIGTDAFILSGVPSRVGRPVVHSYSPGHNGMELWSDGKVKGQFPGSFALEPGTHHLSIRAPEGPVLERRVSLSPGGRFSVEALLNERPDRRSFGLALGGSALFARGAPAQLPAWLWTVAPSARLPSRVGAWILALEGGASIGTLTFHERPTRARWLQGLARLRWEAPWSLWRLRAGLNAEGGILHRRLDAFFDGGHRAWTFGGGPSLAMDIAVGRDWGLRADAAFGVRFYPLEGRFRATPVLGTALSLVQAID